MKPVFSRGASTLGKVKNLVPRAPATYLAIRIVSDLFYGTIGIGRNVLGDHRMGDPVILALLGSCFGKNYHSAQEFKSKIPPE